MKKITPLVSEIYNTSNDPKRCSEAQRAWMYCKDPALEAVKLGVKNQLSEFDNANSLPLGSNFMQWDNILKKNSQMKLGLIEKYEHK